MFGDIALILKEFFTLFKELKLLCFMLPKIKNATDTKIKKRQTIISTLEFLKINKAGTVNRDIQIKLKE